MDWKEYYRDELVRPEGLSVIEGFFSGAEVDPEIDEAIAEQAILSFPHTALSYAGPLQARVIAGLYRARISEVIALGVLHTSVLPPPYAEALDRLRDSSADPEARKAALPRLSGAFFPAGEKITTPFGDLPIASSGSHRLIQEDAGILGREFSLNTFFSLLSFYADRRGVDPLPVVPLYIGITYDPVEDSFAIAAELARALRRLIGPKTGVVTTGDLVHYGTAYGDKARIPRMPKEKRALEGYFLGETEDVLALALSRRNLKEAFTRSLEVLKSDQRYILPVIAELFGPGANYEILHFELSDYAGILSVDPPCYVASSLITYKAVQPL